MDWVDELARLRTELAEGLITRDHFDREKTKIELAREVSQNENVPVEVAQESSIVNSSEEDGTKSVDDISLVAREKEERETLPPSQIIVGILIMIFAGTMVFWIGSHAPSPP